MVNPYIPKISESNKLQLAILLNIKFISVLLQAIFFKAKGYFIFQKTHIHF